MGKNEIWNGGTPSHHAGYSLRQNPFLGTPNVQECSFQECFWVPPDVHIISSVGAIEFHWIHKIKEKRTKQWIGLRENLQETIWLVVWTPLKNISQLGWLFPIYGKIKNVPNHQPDHGFFPAKTKSFFRSNLSPETHFFSEVLLSHVSINMKLIMMIFQLSWWGMVTK